jgi:hypothetical protein
MCYSQGYKTISDRALREVLSERYPVCFNSEKLIDTSCSKIAEEDSLILHGYGIDDISVLKYFKGLKYLSLNDNSIDDLPELPEGLHYLSLDYNNLEQAEILSEGLLHLSMAGNNLSSVLHLPSSLRVLDITENNLSDFSFLPAGLQELYASYNRLNNIASFPAGIRKVVLSENNLKNLPELPLSLHYIDAGSNPLTSAGKLPSGLDTVNLSDTRISGFDSLPSNLIYLNVSKCALLDTLPSLPLSLKYLDFSFTHIRTLPVMNENLQTLNARSCAITSVDGLPESLRLINLSYNPLSDAGVFPDSLRYLDLSYTKLLALNSLPDSLRFLYLLQLTDMRCLPVLPENMIALYTAGSGIQCLSSWPSSPDFVTDVKNVCDKNFNPDGCALVAGINELPDGMMVRVSPNPVSDFLNVDLKGITEVSVSLTDFTGKEIFSRNNMVGFEKLAIDVRNLIAGFYFLQMNCDGNEKVVKVTVNH